MKKQEYVSIGLPVFNGEEYIADAIDSICKQSYPNFELIIYDNASTDNTKEICIKYAERYSNILYYRHNKNIGAHNNFAYALNDAKYDYFMWAAHDDKWDTNFLLKGMEKFDEDNTVNFVMPLWSVCSIKLPLKKNFPIEMFTFVESDDIKKRVITFLRLHHYSHKSNLMYSLFKKDFLKTSFQDLINCGSDLGDDGVFCTIILGNGCGRILPFYFFKKRYKWIFPSRLNFEFLCYTNKIQRKWAIDCYNSRRRKSSTCLKLIFPQFSEEIDNIFKTKHLYKHDKSYFMNHDI
ncbi:MAG: glycosyltransferase [Candidatus Electrothrix sp. AX5]|nr:glycosyltransferase [Candidatus Electrothrix sp. AX5]